MHLIPLVFLFAPILLIHRILQVRKEARQPKPYMFEAENYLRLLENVSEGYEVQPELLVNIITRYDQVRHVRTSSQIFKIANNTLSVIEQTETNKSKFYKSEAKEYLYLLESISNTNKVPPQMLVNIITRYDQVRHLKAVSKVFKLANNALSIEEEFSSDIN